MMVLRDDGNTRFHSLDSDRKKVETNPLALIIRSRRKSQLLFSI